MKINELDLPSHVTLRTFESRDALANELAATLGEHLKSTIDQKGKASIAVSGGSTPLPLFKALSTHDIPWAKTTVTLADDRWVSLDDPASNEQLVKDHLLVNAAKGARFVGFWQKNIQAEKAMAECRARLAELDEPLSAVVLGMGNDGHTASIFPCADELEEALSSNETCMVVKPKSAPHTRVTLTPKRLLDSDLRILHICGEDKVATLAAALASNNPKLMPISLFLQKPLTIYWAP
ncbi:MAG: 6-phosphogluconolactonase [Pontibacterium sp.]